MVCDVANWRNQLKVLGRHYYKHVCACMRAMPMRRPPVDKATAPISSQSVRQWDETEISQTWWAETCQSSLLAHQRLAPRHTSTVQTAVNTPACFTEATTSVNISAQAHLTWIPYWNYHEDCTSLRLLVHDATTNMSQNFVPSVKSRTRCNFQMFRHPEANSKS